MMVEQAQAQDQTCIIKGKRTKRQRPQSPLSLAMVNSTSSSAVESGGGGEVVQDERLLLSVNSGHVMGSSCPTTSLEFTTSTEEEEDMANCLILLAKGRERKKVESSDIIKARPAAGGLYVYECKTCNRCFPSFQALGGHRASHKKPKADQEKEKKALVLVKKEDHDHDHDHHHFNNMSTALSLQIPNRVPSNTINKSNKVHECSICGAEFSSGQALGGHMRRHRAFTTNTSSTAITTTSSTSVGLDDHQLPEAKKPRNLLQLDLNLPAPEDDMNIRRQQESKFGFGNSKEQVIVFSTSSLVDCHY